MKIVVVNSSYFPNVTAGAERVVQMLAGELRRKNHEVTIITTQPTGEWRTEQVDDVRVHYIPVRNVYRPFTGTQPPDSRKRLFHLLDSYNILMMRSVSRALDEERPDVVNTHNLAGFSAAVMQWVSRRGIPLVHTLHDQYLLCLRCTMFRGDECCRRPCMECRVCAIPRRIATTRVNVVVGVSRFILDRHLEFGYFPRAAGRVVYNCAPRGLSEAARPPTARRGVRFGFLGQLRRTKGVHLLVEAFLAAAVPNSELWIAGEGDIEYEEEVRRRADGGPAVRWLGFVRSAELLSAVDVLVVPSIWHDTAPLVILEAFGFGVPVLGARRGGIPEFIRDDTGWLFEPENSGEFRSALTRCVEQRVRLPEMARAARDFAKSFNTTRFVDGYTDAYESRDATQE